MFLIICEALLRLVGLEMVLTGLRMMIDGDVFFSSGSLEAKQVFPLSCPERLSPRTETLVPQ